MSKSDDLRAISSLLSDALSQFIKLFQTEVDLAKAEVSEKARQAGQAIGFLAGGIALVIPAITLALFSLSAVLIDAGWPDAIAYFCSAALALFVAALLIAVGMRRLQSKLLTPSQTLEQLGRDRDTVKGFVR